MSNVENVKQKKIFFATSNLSKLDQAKRLFAKHDIEIEQAFIDYPEDNSLSTQEIAREGAKFCAESLGKPVMVDDTGFFFDAYPGFPGVNTKFVYRKIGYEGIWRLLDGKSREGYFLSAIGYCIPGDDPVVFEDTMKGRITDEQPEYDDTPFPYDLIFVPEGHDKVLRDLRKEGVHVEDHRNKAFLKFIAYLKDN